MILRLTQLCVLLWCSLFTELIAKNFSFSIRIDSDNQVTSSSTPFSLRDASLLDCISVQLVHPTLYRSNANDLILDFSLFIFNGFSEDIFVKTIELDNISVAGEEFPTSPNGIRFFGLLAFSFPEKRDYLLLHGRNRTRSRTGIRQDAAESISFKKRLPLQSNMTYGSLPSLDLTDKLFHVTVRIPVYFYRIGDNNIVGTRVEIPLQIAVTKKE